MTELLKDVFDEASKLPAEEQKALALWIRDELESERDWSRRFSASEGALERLAEEALHEHDRGETRPLEP